MTRLKIIYDFGANNGDDTAYYLRKADKVVAVEANPELATHMIKRFSREIANNRLVVINCALSTGSDNDIVPFYVHKVDSALSRFPRPDDKDVDDFVQIKVLTRDPVSLINEYGPPFYVKIDLETYDASILMEFLRTGIRPNFISAESLSVNVFAALVCLGYTSFNLVDGPTVHTNYADHTINTINGQETYSFPEFSSGPFGQDVKGPWMAPDKFFYYLASQYLGWKDIHATNSILPT